tara:strand:- start:2066 stop:2755 length:690 start_codon:yes stop_codon:yes gene_type:complete
MRLATFLQSYNKPLDCYERMSATCYKFPYETCSAEFLKFAEEDLKEIGKRGNTNALANAKRAVDSQTEAIIQVLGISKAKSFPNRIANLNKVGLVAPRVLTRLSQLRNKLEHDFEVPEREIVEDFLDIASLFLEVTNSVFKEHASQFAVYDKASDYNDLNGFVVELREDKKSMDVKMYKTNGKVALSIINNSDIEYLPLLRLSILTDWSDALESDEELITEMIESIIYA